jgi:hypothetical protein
VVLADATTGTLADTEANQAAYPQPASQRMELGFPVLRLVVLLSLASGARLDAHRQRAVCGQGQRRADLVARPARQLEGGGCAARRCIDRFRNNPR